MTRTRPMTDTDLDWVLELETATFPQPWSRKFFQAGVRATDSCCLVAVADEKPAGYAVGWPEGAEYHLANIAVRGEARRQGIGSTLLAAVIEQARCSGAQTLYLEVRETNIGALAFYRGHGFVITGFRRGYYPDGETAAVMERDA